ncbi:beta-galactosidase [Flavobacterium sp. NG2]|uniref:beta-galactosidase n=1 Tax=Flavobacterium sp. NG2 TaxID=3097547 RepID=UPI002A819AE6|nr:beta-galactosidase [Flavobacterium sp. NG2]WPR71401.1 beta-galactosidase [Flavobacterium sp. NG2]
MRNRKKLNTSFTLLRVLFCNLIFIAVATAQTTENDVQQKINQLKTTIKKAQNKNISTLKEETAIRTAEIFLEYAHWDEQNIAKNTKHFSLVTKYKDEAEKYAKMLPEFERKEMAIMLDDARTELENVLNGKIKRLPTSNVDWTQTKIEKDQISYKGNPVFLADWTWKPDSKKYTDYHGNQDGFFLSPTYVVDNKGKVNPQKIKELTTKPEGSMGFVFFNHSAIPTWAKNEYPEIADGPGLKYTAYDINHPVSRKIQSDLIAATVPLMAGKQYTKLGYMLCNEPHWNTIKKTWTSSPISDLAAKDFKKWLEKKHGTIAVLNKIWKTNFSSFDTIVVPRELETSQQGTPQWFDFASYNMDRVTDWFLFLRDEVKKYDPAAKTHIKVMPNLWTDNKRDHGIDMEALTRNSEIIGNDASTCGPWMWGKPKEWEKHYNFDWVEMCMSYDFYKSISPEKIMYNTEGHFLSTGKYRDLYQTKDYVRCNYWQAYVHGLTAIQTWYWARLEDGSSREHFDSNGYAASNNHQPRVVNEVHATVADLNSVSDIIMGLQRQEKPIRIFYTKASSINKEHHMEDVFKVYEKMFFEGTPVGFATQGIIENNDNKTWETILISDTPIATESDMSALQKYLNNGGVVIMDENSLKTNEYGMPLTKSLVANKGKIILVKSLDEMKTKAFDLLKMKNKLPLLKVDETNGLDQKACDWRVFAGKNGAQFLNIANYGKNTASLSLTLANGKTPTSVTNYLTGEKMSSNFKMAPNVVYLLEVK